jgi:hypothetical protein
VCFTEQQLVGFGRESKPSGISQPILPRMHSPRKSTLSKKRKRQVSLLIVFRVSLRLSPLSINGEDRYQRRRNSNAAVLETIR